MEPFLPDLASIHKENPLPILYSAPPVYLDPGLLSDSATPDPSSGSVPSRASNDSLPDLSLESEAGLAAT